MSEPVIEISGLKKSYGPVEAVRGVDLTVESGEIFAFLGPNGAGKTTTTEILEGYRDRDAGDVSVLGVDPGRPTSAWRARIGIVLQASRVDTFLTVRELVEQFAGFYPHPRPVDETIELVGLAEQAGRRSGKMSGGQQRRLDVALAIVGDPDLVFLDEPTTGFDPTARRAAWDLVSGLRDLGKTVFLTTHYMDEAQALADRAAIIRDGRIVAEGKPSELGGRDSRTFIRFTLPAGIGIAELPIDAQIEDGRAVATVASPLEPLDRLTSWATSAGHALDDLEVERPSLEDVYIELTKEQA